MMDELLILVLVGAACLNLGTWLVVLGRLQLILDFILKKEGD